MGGAEAGHVDGVLGADESARAAVDPAVARAVANLPFDATCVM